jgi:hypothetical protein
VRSPLTVMARLVRAIHDFAGHKKAVVDGPPELVLGRPKGPTRGGP